MRKRWLGVLLGAVILLVGVSGSFASVGDVKITPPTRELFLYNFLTEAVEIKEHKLWRSYAPEGEDWGICYSAQIRKRFINESFTLGFTLRVKPTGVKITELYQSGAYELEILFDKNRMVVFLDFKAGKDIVIPVRVKISKICETEEEALWNSEKVLQAMKHDQELLIKKAWVSGTTFFEEEDLEEKNSPYTVYYRLKDEKELEINFFLPATVTRSGEISVIEEEKE